MHATFEFRCVAYPGRELPRMEVAMADLYDGNIGPDQVIDHFGSKMERLLDSMRREYLQMRGRDGKQNRERMRKLGEEIVELETRITYLPKAFKAECPFYDHIHQPIYAFSEYWKDGIRISRNIQEDQGCIVPPKQ